MKRTRFILLVMVAALVLMGAGYAAWTQTFTITSTVSAGELFVKISETHKAEIDAGNGYTTEGANNYLDLSDFGVTTTSNNAANTDSTLATVSYNVGKVFPGTRLTSTLTFRNNGTMKTKVSFNNASSEVIGAGNALWQAMRFTINGSPVSVNSESADAVKGNIGAALAEAVGELEPGDSVEVIIVQEIDRDTGEAAEGKSLNWKIVLQFDQNISVQTQQP